MEKFKDLNIKTKIAYITAIGSLCIGWILVIINFCVSPVGEVSDSSLWILGQCFIYIGSVIGITQYSKNSINDIREEIGLKKKE